MTAYDTGRQIRMTENNTLWHCFEMPSRDGALLLADPTNIALANLVMQDPELIKSGRALMYDYSAGSNVYESPDRSKIALKVCEAPEGQRPGRYGTFADLVGTLAVYEGLNEKKGRPLPGTQWNIRGFEVQAAYMSMQALKHAPDELGRIDRRPQDAPSLANSSVWAVERLRRRHPSFTARNSDLGLFPTDDACWHAGYDAIQRAGLVGANQVAPLSGALNINDLVIEKVPHLLRRGSLVMQGAQAEPR
jgi:hypothetical protein